MPDQTLQPEKFPDRALNQYQRNVAQRGDALTLLQSLPDGTKRLIGAVTESSDLIVDPAAGSFAVLHAALALGRDFIGVDIAFGS